MIRVLCYLALSVWRYGGVSVWIVLQGLILLPIRELLDRFEWQLPEVFVKQCFDMVRHSPSFCVEKEDAMARSSFMACVRCCAAPAWWAQSARGNPTL